MQEQNSEVTKGLYFEWDEGNSADKEQEGN